MTDIVTPPDDSTPRAIARTPGDNMRRAIARTPGDNMRRAIARTLDRGMPCPYTTVIGDRGGGRWARG